MAAVYGPVKLRRQTSAPTAPASGFDALYANSTGQMVVEDTAGTNRNLPFEFFYNVRDYGAKGDGTTNDYAAFQAAIDKASLTNPGNVVYIPAGNYNIDTGGGSNTFGLELKGSCWILAAPGAVIRRGNSAMQYLLQNFNASYAPTGYNGRGNIRITGGVWDGAGDVFTTNVTVMIFAHGDNILVENAVVQNVVDWHGVEFNSTQNGRAVNVTVQGFRALTSGREISEAIQIDGAYAGGAIPGIGAGALDNTPCTDIKIEGCTVRNFGSLGSFGRLVGSHSYIDNKFHSGIRVTRCYATGLGDYGVRAYNWWDAVISECEFVNCNGAFMADVPSAATVGHEGFTFTKNICRNLGVQNGGTAVLDYAVLVNGIDATGSVPVRENIISNNILKTIANAQAAIRIVNTADVICEDNIIKDGTGVATRGINLVGSSNARVDGNKISNVNGVGIHVYDGSNSNSGYINCQNNIVQGTGAEGIHINSTSPTITNNNINGVNGGVAGLAVWTNCANGHVVGNRVEKGSGGTSGVEIRANLFMFMANSVTKWTTNTTANGASGQNVFVNSANGGAVFPAATQTYNKC